MSQQVRLKDRKHGGDPSHSGAKHPISGLKQKQNEKQTHHGFGQTRSEEKGVRVVPVNKRPAFNVRGGFGIVAPHPGNV